MMQRGGPRPHVQRLLLYVYAYTKDSKIVEPELLVEVEAGCSDCTIVFSLTCSVHNSFNHTRRDTEILPKLDVSVVIYH